MDQIEKLARDASEALARGNHLRAIKPLTKLAKTAQHARDLAIRGAAANGASLRLIAAHAGTSKQAISKRLLTGN